MNRFFTTVMALALVSAQGTIAEVRDRNAIAPEDQVGQGVVAFNDQKLNAADELFSKAIGNDKKFRIALREVQKVLYKKAQWDRFFGIATYYRKNLMMSHYEPQIMALEILALIKHCHFDVAQKLIDTHRPIVRGLIAQSTESFKRFRMSDASDFGGDASYGKQLALFSDQLDAFQELLDLQKQLPNVVNTKDIKPKSKGFTHELEWNITPEQRSNVLTAAVKNMRAVRVYVQDRCEQTAKNLEKVRKAEASSMRADN
jgi:hypothetical protein